MPDPIGHYSPTAIIAAIEGNLADASTALGRNEDGVIFRGSDVTWVYSGTTIPSRILSAHFTPEDAQDRVSQIHGFFKEWKAPVSWVVGPTSYPPVLGEYLSASGFAAAESWTGMALDLSNRPEINKVDSLQIKEVRDEPSLRACDRLSTDEAMNIFSPANAAAAKHYRFYLGQLNNKPVTRAMAVRSNDIVGLHWITMLNPRRDISAAIAHRAMNDAARAGAKAAVMAVPSDSLDFCRELGFKPYCEFQIYSWPKAPHPESVC